MTFIDLFRGIGGFRLGMEQAGNSVTVNVIKFIAERMRIEGEQNGKKVEKKNF